ncbi:hypothetical protein GPECTOR_11g255 [Gonium pectorale]|uniref:Uncharacterized protein n=1 Tax=Gonium pectorale TaxID=33097 RepID=A0A150GPT9_GONPE|nr:hypothetical protein GPECTOR_11g255 [Gonium pectorale]|eukprot:KXZ51814.1 hypothetical protein GPECTOR_11g255 [Gonium pectorale]
MMLQRSVPTAHFSHNQRLTRLPNTAPVRRWGGPRWVLRAEPEDKPDASFESLFSKELQRRRLSSLDDEDGTSSSGSLGKCSGSSSAPADGSGAAPGTNPFASNSGGAGSTTRTRPRAPPPPRAASGEDDQRQRSMDMVTEGLEGLIPRASLLLRLGGGVFLAFLPFMLVFSALFTGIFYVFGDNFLHGGRTPSGPPRYIDPELLLSEPTVDPYVPYNTNPYTAPDLR